MPEPPVGDHRTARLLLRRWREEDLAPFARLNADPEVMEHFPAPLGRADSDALAARADAGIAERGWGLWAVEVVDPAADRWGFAGFAGLSVPRFEACFTPCVEVGWRLARWAWGHGYATEAGREALRVAFEEAALDDVVSFTAAPNTRSRAVMRRLGMVADGEFEHPALPVGHPLRRHVLHRLTRERWRGQCSSGRSGPDAPT
ncbi:GNAT family N-acetyltransferase [Kineococcus sp. SYSU DK004]|uniref:GNAT family N-acetyltransferase n=1 Tax=Kineococcus sp. SYSU DK004 TaxID=3383125 RepID=UPI003D7DECEE